MTKCLRISNFIEQFQTLADNTITALSTLLSHQRELQSAININIS